ncbi:MAG: glycosyltransferase [Planctomycetota bacterium]|nr:MAG: glycosyltransferase [Planctomycetota bacterium]
MRPIRSVSVLMPTWQGIELLERAVTALAAQETDIAWDFRIIDSGSTDGTWELLAGWRKRFPVPLAMERIEQVEFDHGDTRNLLAARSTGDLLVFLTQDAIPGSPDWLATLARNFTDERVGAAYCRNVPRSDADVLTRIFSAGDPGYALERRAVRLPEPAVYADMDPGERRLLYNFNDVASAVRRELWERHPFPRATFGEDVLMARALLEAGFTVVYDAAATVEHSHDYDAAETYARSFVDGRFNAEWLDRTCVRTPKDVKVLTARLSAEDAAAIRALGALPEAERALLVHAHELRAAAFLGLHDGGRSSLRHPATRLRERTDLSILYVVHGFPPETWAGTEVYAFNLATEMQRRGHRCTVLTRVPADERELPDFHVEESEFQGLRVLRMTHRLAHANLRESYHEPRAEAAFRRVLLAEQPDVVHFQHLIHTSAGLVHVARELGHATVITCHDYWAVCARVQLIRPDGRICERNMGAGCYLCVKDERLPLVPVAERIGAAAGAVIEGFAREVAESPVASAVWRRRAAEYVDLAERQEFVLSAYAAADLRISPSRFLRSKLLETGRFSPHTFLYSDNGMRTDHIHALEHEPPADGRVRFGFIGSLVWYKGGDVLVRAMRRLAGTKAVLNVYGDFQPDAEPHHAELAELAGDNVRFMGRFDNARLSEVYAEVDVLVVPSVWYENSPITIHEAFLTKTPILASDIGGMVEFVRDGVNGLHFRVGDDADLAAKMRRFLDEPELLARLATSMAPVKTIGENAQEMEFRYRGLACRVRDEGAGALLLDYEGRDASQREGPVEEQGSDMLLLRPGGAAVEYDLAAAAGIEVDVGIEIFALAAEPETEHGGRVLVDGREIGRLPLLRAHGADELHKVVIATELPAGSRRLRLETAVREGGPEASLRVKRVTVRRRKDAPSVGGQA